MFQLLTNYYIINMSLWKISVKSTGTVNGLRLEKGMFVELLIQGSTMQTLPTYKTQIAQLFLNKYGIDLLERDLVKTNILSCEKIK